MKKSTISFQVELDNHNIPEKIEWNASDKPADLPADTKSVSIAVWDHKQKNTLRIDLWSKDMPVQDMKRFYVECIGGLSQSVLTATGDQFMADAMNDLCDRLVDHIKKEQNK